MACIVHQIRLCKNFDHYQSLLWAQLVSLSYQCYLFCFTRPTVDKMTKLYFFFKCRFHSSALRVGNWRKSSNGRSSRDKRYVFHDYVHMSDSPQRRQEGVDKTRNMEHSGSFRNIPEHWIIMIIVRKICKINFTKTEKTSNLEAAMMKLHKCYNFMILL